MAAVDAVIQATEEQDSSNDHLSTNADAKSEELAHEESYPSGQPSSSTLHHDTTMSMGDGTFREEHQGTAESTDVQLPASTLIDDEAMGIAKDSFGDEHQDTEMSTRPAEKNTKRGTMARTAQEYIANLKNKKERELKKHFIKQINLKRRSGDSIIVLEPPQAKRRRQQKVSTSSHGDPDEVALPTTTKTDIVPELVEGGIPNSDQNKVLKKDRRKQIAAATSEGDSNRHLSSQKEDAELGMKIWGLNAVDCVGPSDYKLRGIRTTIRGWQLQAATLMLLRENSHAPPYGGILGDQMGMGKTLTTLVLIMGCPPLPQDLQAGCGGTIVVVPGPNVLKEWSDAITRHTEIRPQDVLVYKQGTNIFAADQIAGYKIVLTTYQELLKYPSGKRLSELAESYGQGTQEFQNAVKHVAGPIFDIEWYRVVFDELHTIKNSETQTFHACYRLKSKRVWGLSGTPLINRSKEIFPYVKLIGVEGIQTKKDYELIYKKGPNSFEKSHENRFLGKQMLEGLPQFEAEVRWVNLSQEERLIYDAITQYFDSQPSLLPIVSMAQKRQAISHPYLLEKLFAETIDNESIQKLVNDLKEIEGNIWVYHQIGRRFGRRDPDNAFAAGKNDAGDVPELTPRELAYAPMNPFGKSTFGQKFSMVQLLELTIMDKEFGKSKCGECEQKKKATDRIRINGCKHVFCQICLWKRMRDLDPMAQHQCPVPTCTNIFKENDIEMVSTLAKRAAVCVSSDEESTDEDSDDNRYRSRKGKVAEKRRKAQAKREKRKMRRRKYGGDYIGNLPALEENDTSFLQIGVNENGGVPCPGTKLTVAKEIILQWQKEAPNDKIIIFVEFIKTAVLLGIVLNLEDIPFVYLNGKLTSKEKLKAVDTFKTNPEVKILIASMKVGGQALNLTCANRVIQVDSWWNEAAGEQANGRVNRMGQLKPSHAVVIKARGTIDDYITDLQNSKTKDIEHILQDNGRVTEVYSEFEVMALTAPVAWQTLKQRVVDDIEREMGPQGVK
ncbi:P-loop containing nucleoside triphosphate hydrolase protein [Colletotrichum navitas]|uniref:P-loop containing nucleoside triphosphate hydrolase protein n=1 Tax=Colletotrichum navitas TaxID=681940 RepID=A0AAD8UY45_9PEZI|nr:P-loop containing nucleoside triphosphate hydrolase protein [Colletotrichum navitas]KAK1566419.1 P-loop containing nucleoside triphosphate hydrolase protein [Colletotrichum navitas]